MSSSDTFLLMTIINMCVSLARNNSLKLTKVFLKCLYLYHLARK